MTLSKYFILKGIYDSIWVCFNCRLFLLKTNCPSSIFFHQSWKYLSWIPLFSCNSLPSCFTVICCQQCIWFISQVFVGQGLPHSSPGPAREKLQRGRQSLGFPQLGRLQVGSKLSQHSWSRAPHTRQCLLCRWAEKHKRQEEMSVCGIVLKWATSEVLFGVMFIFMFCKTNMDLSKMYPWIWHWED